MTQNSLRCERVIVESPKCGGALLPQRCESVTMAQQGFNGLFGGVHTTSRAVGHGNGEEVSTDEGNT